MPYFSYLSMLHLYETFGWWRAGADLRKGGAAVVKRSVVSKLCCSAVRARLQTARASCFVARALLLPCWLCISTGIDAHVVLLRSAFCGGAHFGGSRQLQGGIMCSTHVAICPCN